MVFSCTYVRGGEWCGRVRETTYLVSEQKFLSPLTNKVSRLKLVFCGEEEITCSVGEVAVALRILCLKFRKEGFQLLRTSSSPSLW